MQIIEGICPIVIAGPTASGKSSAAIQLAHGFKKLGIDSEIINADSVQVYHDLKKLTAYPSSEDMSEVPHNLYGFLNANEKISVADWKILADKKIDELLYEKKVPIICGGTGFYINALLNGIAEIPDISAEFRKAVQQKFEKDGREKFFQDLVKLDPKIVDILHPNNTQRILRAYEVVAFTKIPLSDWWQEPQAKGRECLSIVILPPRNILIEQIRKRAEMMIDNGAIDEVSSFLKIYPNYVGPLDKVIGFNEIKSLLKGDIDKSELLELMTIKTRQYAKRQSTWFRHQLSDAIFIQNSSEIENVEELHS